MRLLIDAQPPPALARWFVSKGHDAAHVFGIEFHRSSDEEIWKFALDNDLILMTKDEDFSSRVGSIGPPSD
jgi:predicted nuclease of predicted toxin-antitoxin system